MKVKIIESSLDTGNFAGSKGLFDVTIKQTGGGGTNPSPGTAGSKGLFEKIIKQTGDYEDQERHQ